MWRSTWRVTWLVLAALTWRVAPAPAAVEIEGVQFPPSYKTEGVELELSCVGLMRYMYVLKGYVAGLYLAEEEHAEDVLADVPKRLELSYFWDIAGADIGDAGDKLVAQNVDAETLTRLRPQLDQIRSLYENVRPGDRYALTYVPGRGTELALNGKPKGTIPGADFARAYFAIWLGAKPIDADLKKQLLQCS